MSDKPDLQWTDRPSGDGWYWHRQGRDVQVLYVDGGYAYSALWMDSQGVRVTGLGGRWWGPLPEPPDPERGTP